MTDTTIIDQPNKFLINCLIFEFDLIKLGRTRIKTAIKKIITSLVVFKPINNIEHSLCDT